MRPDVFKKAVDEAEQIGVYLVTLNGGEPLCHPDFLEMVTYAACKQMLVVTYISGFGLSQEHIDRLSCITNLQLMISMNGSTEEINGLSRDGYSYMEQASLLTNELYGRLRFTLAHELAHYIIHKGIFCGTGVAAALYDNNADEDMMEWQANYLARAMLMPNGQVKRCFYKSRSSCRCESEFVKRLASIFEVSKQAMKIRLKDFGLI